MARIALIDPGGRATTTVQAVLGRAHDVIVRSRIHAPGDCDLVIADLRYEELADTSTLRSLRSFGPVLLLVERLQPIPTAVEESGDLSVLRKPFDAFELRIAVERLLKAVRRPTPRPLLAAVEDDDAQWLEFPFVPAPAGAVLRRAARMAAPLWILGEAGTGRRRVAMAVCRGAEARLRVVTLFPDEKLADVLERERSSEPFALFVPEIDARPLLEQERMAVLLGGRVGFRLIATSIDDPAERILTKEFSRNLYQHLIGLAVQLSPLRERPVTIPPLVQAMVRRIARGLALGSEISFSPEAMARLQTYLWPGNLVELEAVLNRTLVHLPDAESAAPSVGPDEILFTPDDVGRPRSPGGSRASTLASLPTLAGMPNLARLPTRVAASGGGAAGTAPDLVAEVPGTAARGSNADLRQVVAGLAHDLRNPMTAIKTFASSFANPANPMASREADEDARRLGDLAGEACTRIDGYLEALQAFGELGQPSPRRSDLLALLKEAVEGLPDAEGSRVSPLTDTVLKAEVDPAQMVFAFENVLAGMLAESAPTGIVRVRADGEKGLVFEAPVGRGPIVKLRALLEEGADRAMSWRLLLAAAACEKNGFKVVEEIVGDTLIVRCRPEDGEVETRDEQTHRTSR
jgi:DNA-binding NtrC family response regulator